MAECSICFKPMTLKCDLSTTPCEHLFHTICIKNIRQNLEIPAGQGYFDIAQNPLILTLLARKMVCYYCGNLNIQLFKISFKTADEINNFAKRMKKIDQNASYSSNENKEFENNFQNLSLENFSKDFFYKVSRNRFDKPTMAMDKWPSPSIQSSGRLRPWRFWIYRLKRKLQNFWGRYPKYEGFRWCSSITKWC